MSIVSHTVHYVVGVDTHAKTHTFAVVNASGQLLDTQQFPTHPAGLTRALEWIARRTQGLISDTLITVEGTSSYGAQLTSQLARSGYRVVEAPFPQRHGSGKTDALDAQRAALATLPMPLDQLRDHRRHDDARDAIQALLTLRDHYSTTRTATLNMLTALLRSTDLGVDARSPLRTSQITAIASWRPRQEPDWKAELRRAAITHAADIIALDQRLRDNQTRLRSWVTRHTPALLQVKGIGPVGAGVVIAAWSHPGRIRNEDAFAMLAGTAPVPASSGNTQRHRLNRGGDRQLNRAMHTMTNTLKAHDPETQAYVERRLKEGKNKREIQRCLKRYNTRRLHKIMTRAHLDKP